MGVRPPRQGDDDAPDAIAFGIAALDEHLQRADVAFPTTAGELVEALDDPAVPFDATGNVVRFSTVVEEADLSSFETRQELLNALHPVFEARRQRANDSLVGRLRSLVPF